MTQRLQGSDAADDTETCSIDVAQPACCGCHWPRRGVPLRSGPRGSAKTRAPPIVGPSRHCVALEPAVAADACRGRTTGAFVSPPGLIARCEPSTGPENAVGALPPWHSLGAEQSSEDRQTWLPMKARTSRYRTTDPSGQPTLCSGRVNCPAGSPVCCDRRHAPRISGSRNRPPSSSLRTRKHWRGRFYDRAR